MAFQRVGASLVPGARRTQMSQRGYGLRIPYQNQTNQPTTGWFDSTNQFGFMRAGGTAGQAQGPQTAAPGTTAGQGGLQSAVRDLLMDRLQGPSQGVPLHFTPKLAKKMKGAASDNVDAQFGQWEEELHDQLQLGRLTPAQYVNELSELRRNQTARRTAAGVPIDVAQAESAQKVAFANAAGEIDPKSALAGLLQLLGLDFKQGEAYRDEFNRAVSRGLASGRTVRAGESMETYLKKLLLNAGVQGGGFGAMLRNKQGKAAKGRKKAAPAPRAPGIGNSLRIAPALRG